MKGRKSLATALSVILVMSLINAATPGVSGEDKIARAATTAWFEGDAGTADARTVCLSTDGIGNPTSGDTKGLTGWTGSYVYFGNYEGSPIKFRVLKNRVRSINWYNINQNFNI